MRKRETDLQEGEVYIGKETAQGQDKREDKREREKIRGRRLVYTHPL